jgi:hypothetical protein
MRLAAVDADTLAEQFDEPLAVVIRTRARHAIRQLAQQLPSLSGTTLPHWATAPITDQHLALVNATGRACHWPELRATIDEHNQVLFDPDIRAALTALIVLYPENPVPVALMALLDQIDQSGLEATLQYRQDAHDRVTLARDWVNAGSWAESLAFHRAHQTALATPEMRDLLSAYDDDTVRQHAAILTVADWLPIDALYALVTDPDAAEDAALHAVEEGHVDRLAALMTASPALRSKEVTMALLEAVQALAVGQSDRARELVTEISGHAGPAQRQAYAVHLRGLHRHNAQLDGLTDLIEILSSPASHTSGSLPAQSEGRFAE